jgi:hypothetical protein
VIALLALVACDTDPSTLSEVFDGPTHAIVLHPDQGGPFYEPVGIVSSERSGALSLLDLKHGWYLADDGASPFLPSTNLATGSRRILGPLAVYAPDDSVTIFVADRWTGTLLEVPWISGAPDGIPVEVDPALTDAGVTVNSDAALSLDVTLRPGRAGTETWTLTSNGTEWTVEGTRSGVQSRKLRPLEPWTSDVKAVTLLLEGKGNAGDTVVFDVDTGTVEHEVGGVVNDVLLVGGQTWLLASVTNLAEDTTALVAINPADPSAFVEIPLQAGAHPWRIATDRSGDVVYVGDSTYGAVYELILDVEDPAASPMRVLATDGPVVDLAWQGTETYEHLFVAVRGENRVDVLDLASDTWLDLNPATPERDGMNTESPVTGMAAPSYPVLLERTGSTGERDSDHVVAVSTFEGVLMTLEGETGCQSWDTPDGPYAYQDLNTPYSDAGATSNPTLDGTGATGEEISVNPCAGLAEAESWLLTFDGAQGNWVVEGALSGIQSERAWSDSRYVNDNGTISFTILSGTQAATDGDRFLFHVVDGFNEVAGDFNGDGLTSLGEVVIEVPGRPAAFSYLAGPEDGGWEQVNRKVGVLWPITNQDEVYRVNLQTGLIDNVWQ